MFAGDERSYYGFTLDVCGARGCHENWSLSRSPSIVHENARDESKVPRFFTKGAQGLFIKAIIGACLSVCEL